MNNTPDLDFDKLFKDEKPKDTPKEPKNLPKDLYAGLKSGFEGGVIGAEQLLADAASAVNFGTPGKLANMVATNLRNKEAARQKSLSPIKAKYGDPGLANPISWAETAGEMAPQVALTTEEAAPEAVSIGRAILRGMGSGLKAGAVAGATSPLTSGQSRPMATALGAGTGMALGAATGPIISKLTARPTTAALAGETLDKIKETTPIDQEMIAKEQSGLDEAAKKLGVTMPSGTSANIRENNLVSDRARANPALASGLTAQKKQAESIANDMVPDANPNVVRMVRNTLNRARAKVDAEKAATAEQFGKTLPPKGSPDEMATLGSKVKDRLQQAKRDIKSYFDNQYSRYDKWKTYTKNKDFISAADKLKGSSAESGNVIGNYIDLSGMLDRLKQTVVDSQGNEVKEMPPDFNLSTWRSLKRELSDAANRANRSGHYTASQQLGGLAEIAKAKEFESTSLLPAPLREQYNSIGAAYKNMMHIPTREGYAGGILKNNSTVRPTAIASRLNSIDNANDLMRVIGSHLETQRLGGEAPKDISAESLMAAGKKTAGELAKPYFMGQVRAIYDNAGGGIDGVKSVNKWLRNTDNKNILEHYGIDADFNAFRGNAEKAIKQIENVPSDQISKNGVANNIVKGVLGVESPFKLFDAVANTANPKSAIEELYAVSKSPTWRNAVRDVLRTSAKEKGDIFNNPKYASILPYMFNKEELSTLDAFHKVTSALNKSSVRTKVNVEEPASGALHGAYEFTHRLPTWDIWKRVLKFAVGTKLKTMMEDSQNEILSYIDEAILDPPKAKNLTEALKGSRYYQQKLGTDLERYVPAKKALNVFKNLSIASGLGYYGPSAPDRKQSRVPSGLSDYIKSSIDNKGE